MHVLINVTNISLTILKVTPTATERHVYWPLATWTNKAEGSFFHINCVVSENIYTHP